MSFDAVCWAMEQVLPTTQKMVLVSLAHRMNSKTGDCFPSLTRIASDSGMTKMSVTRQIDKLESSGYLTVIRTVKNGEKQNNHYKLSLGGSNRELLPSNTELLPSNTELLGVVTESYGGSNRELHKQGIQQGNLTKKTTTTIENSGSGNFENLIYPSSLSPAEKQAASKLLENCNGEKQAILDTLAGAIQAKEIKKTPLSYLGGLVRRYESGEFDPSGAISIAHERTKKADRAAIVQKQCNVSTEEVLNELAAIRKAKLEPVLLADKIIEDADKVAAFEKFKQGLRIKPRA